MWLLYLSGSQTMSPPPGHDTCTWHVWVPELFLQSMLVLYKTRLYRVQLQVWELSGRQQNTGAWARQTESFVKGISKRHIFFIKEYYNVV